MPHSRQSHSPSDDPTAFVAEAARRAFVLDEIPNLAAVPALFTRRLRSVYVAPDAPSGGVELHAVGIYEGRAGDGDAPAPSAPPAVRIAVRRSEHPVALFLMSYKAVRWEVRVDAHARLAGVFLSSAEPSLVRCAAPLAAIMPLSNAPQVYELDPRQFGENGGRAVLKRIRQATGRELTSFQGDYYGVRFTVPPYRDAALARAVIAAHGAGLRERTARAPAPFWLIDDAHIVRWGGHERPIAVRPDIKAVTFCDADGRFYGVSDHDLYAIDAGGALEPIAPPAHGWSWLGGVTYDGKRRRLVVSTFWHAGAHHLYDPVAGTWLAAVDVGRTGGGIRALAYDADRDVFFAVTSGLFGARITSYTADLDPLGDAPHSTAVPFPEGFSPDWPVVQLAVVGSTLAIVLSTDPTIGSERVQRMERGFLVRIDSDEVNLLDMEPQRPWATGAAAVRTAADPDAAAAPAPGEPRDAEGSDKEDAAPYQGSVTVYELRRDANAIIRQVATTQQPLMILASGHGYAVLANYERYLGQLASLDEMQFADWSERLERAAREIADATVATPVRCGWPTLANVVWTPQAAEDLESLVATLNPNRARIMHHFLFSGAVPMDGRYAGYGCSASPLGFRTVYQKRDDGLWIAYIRQGVKHLWGPLSEAST